MRHTRYGYWLEEAGPVEPTRPLDGDTSSDVVIVAVVVSYLVTLALAAYVEARLVDEAPPEEATAVATPA